MKRDDERCENERFQRSRTYGTFLGNASGGCTRTRCLRRTEMCRCKSGRPYFGEPDRFPRFRRELLSGPNREAVLRENEYESACVRVVPAAERTGGGRGGGEGIRRRRRLLQNCSRCFLYYLRVITV